MLGDCNLCDSFDDLPILLAERDGQYFCSNFGEYLPCGPILTFVSVFGNQDPCRRIKSVFFNFLVPKNYFLIGHAMIRYLYGFALPAFSLIAKSNDDENIKE